jgi:hypothetical protein
MDALQRHVCEIAWSLVKMSTLGPNNTKSPHDVMLLVL